MSLCYNDLLGILILNYCKRINIEMLLSADRQSPDTTGTPDVGTVSKGKGSRPKNKKPKSAGIHSRSTSVPSGGSGDADQAPKKGRGRARRSTNRDQSVEPTKTLDESQVVSSRKAVARSALVDSAHNGTCRGAGSGIEENQSLQEHSSSELMSALGLKEKKPIQSDIQNMSHSEMPNGSEGVTQAESVETPLVKRKGQGRSRKTQHLSGASPADGLSPMNRVGDSNEKTDFSDNMETKLGQSENNCLVNQKVDLKPSEDVMASTPVVPKSGKKRGRPRKSETHDRSLESSQLGEYSLDKEIDFVEDIEPPKKKRGRPRKTTNDPVKTGLGSVERGSETLDEESLKTRRRSRRITNDPVETGPESEERGSETSDDEPLVKKKIKTKQKKSPKIKVEAKVRSVLALDLKIITNYFLVELLKLNRP